MVRRGAVIPMLALALVLPSAARGAYTSTASGTTAILTGTSASDTLVIERVGSLLTHNRDPDPGFDGPDDFNTAVGGVQQLTDGSGSTLVINAGGGDDTVVLGAAAGTPGSSQLTQLFVSGESSNTLGGDSLTVQDGNAASALTYSLAEQQLLTGSGRAVNFEGFDNLTITSGSGGDLLTVSGNPLVPATTFNGGGAGDGLELAPGVTVPDGTFNGGLGEDRLDYTGWTTPVAAGLGDKRLLGADLDGAQETAPVMTAATGRAAMVIDASTPEFELLCAIKGIDPSRVTGAHIHAPGPPGVDAPVIYDLGVENWVRTGDGMALRLVAPALGFPEAHRAALLAGNAYINVHTVDNPDGEVRGQLRPGAAEGSATGVESLDSVESVLGGDGPDLLDGTITDNALSGNGGNDVVRGDDGLDTLTGGTGGDLMVGNEGADTLDGGAGDDLAAWQAGEGVDIIDGGAAGADRLLAGGTAGGDVLGLAADGARVDLTGAGTTLDVGGFEELALAGLGGADGFTVGPGVTPPAAIDGGDGVDSLSGGEADDVLDGGVGSDSVVGGGGDDEVFLSSGRGTDNVDGGPDSDVLTVMGTANPDNVVFAGGGPFSAVLAGVTLAAPIVGVEQLAAIGDAGGDVLDADALPSGGPEALLVGGAGGDELLGGGAADIFDAGAGDDLLMARDGVVDRRIECGEGTDSGEADTNDPLLDCEAVARPPQPPQTTITRKPKNKTKKRKATFEFTSSQPGSTFECKLDNGGFKPCTSPHAVRVKKGKHTFKVRAVKASNVDPTPAKDAWKVIPRRKG